MRRWAALRFGLVLALTTTSFGLCAAPSPLAGEGAPGHDSADRQAQPAETASFPSLYTDPQPFLAAIAAERQPAPARPPTVTGITVPHHLLAADLIARGFWAAQGNRYDRIVILSPDHFNRSRKPLATSAHDFDTVFGRLATDRDAVGTLVADSELFEVSDLFDREHGIAALLPFAKHFFPDAKIVPIAISLRAGRAEWDRATALLEKLAGPGTLVVQSTDYSHYLPVVASLARDQETLNVIAAEDPAAIERLVSSDHMDSRGAQYVQMSLQASRGSRGTVIASRNSVEYVPHASRTTSYLVSVYATETEAFPYAYPDQEVLVFGGDAFPGRWLTKALATPAIADAIAARVRTLTGGAPLVLNLEGVLLTEPPEGIGDHLHAIHAGLALPILKAMNVKAAGLANNHSFDLGRDGYRETIAHLERTGIMPMPHGRVADLGPVRIIPLNFVGRNDRSGFPVVREGDLDTLCRAAARPPLVAFVHWGVEYATDIGPAEYEAARNLHRCGVGAIIGAHSHRAAARIEAPQGGEYALLPSLGNFLFDQTSPRGTGALLELRRFRQGTFAVRLIPLPNLFELGNALLRGREAGDVTGSDTGPSGGSAGNR
ncbi:AmmeMemoRadiSam system protein B [uncultured Enterovirga sp.]|uniref:AmmeMemoRadiSam system protein B n=1 Tax=uncultured Enterovirga sp. TaxID=2026352 RepID=UPI0035CB2595